MKSNDQHRKGRAQKMLLLLPLLILPIVTVLFRASGGGSPASEGPVDKKGFNSKLPAPQFKDDQGMDKLNYYDQASQEAIKLDELRKKDPNYRFTDSDSVSESIARTSPLKMNRYQSPQEEKVYQKLEALQRAISRPVPTATSAHSDQRPSLPAMPWYGAAADFVQAQPTIDTPSQADPEMQQISGMLENILDLQYPERMEQKLKQESLRNRGHIYTVALQEEHDVIGCIDDLNTARERVTNEATRQNGFYGLEETNINRNDNAVQAVVAEAQTLVNGAMVKMLLAQDIFVSGNKIPKNTFIYGTASLKGERLDVEITSVRHGNSIYPVALAVFDLDGLPGIYIPGAITREVAKSSADRSMQTLGAATLSDSWGAQAAGVGIEAAKGLFSRKVKLIKVGLKAGYAVLLKDKKQID